MYLEANALDHFSTLEGSRAFVDSAYYLTSYSLLFLQSTAESSSLESAHD